MNNSPNSTNLLNALLESLATAFNEIWSQIAEALSGFLNSVFPF